MKAHRTTLTLLLTLVATLTLLGACAVSDPAEETVLDSADDEATDGGVTDGSERTEDTEDPEEVESAVTPDDGDDGVVSDDASTGEDLTMVTIGLIPVIDVAPLYLGVSQGIFADHGLELDIQLAQGGAAIVPAVVSGEYQFGFSNTVSLMVAKEQGIPITVVANGSRSTNEPGADAVEVAVPGDSDITTAADLEGVTIAINALNNFGDITTRNSVEAAGGDPDGVQFVEVPYPNMPAQLAAGEIDAAWTGEPFRTQILDEGGRIVASPLTDLADDVDLAYYFTSEQVQESDPEVVEAFVDALHESFAYATEHEDEVRAELVEYAGLDPDVAERVVLTRWPEDINTDALMLLGERAVELGAMDSPPDLDTLILQ